MSISSMNLRCGTVAWPLSQVWIGSGGAFRRADNLSGPSALSERFELYRFAFYFLVLVHAMIVRMNAGAHSQACPVAIALPFLLA